MRKTIMINILLLLLACCESVKAQGKDTLNTGKAGGVVRDSARNFGLRAASVSIYRSDNGRMISYQLTNAYGQFQFNNLPVETQLLVKASFVGYQTYSRPFFIPESNRNFDLKNLHLQIRTDTLHEVVVSYIPPVQMNGDTLEFNADAFKLDSNAVVEDLMRQLPGITIWGDGTITFNGREIKRVLVEGKPFLGGDARVATQNLTKTSVDKIQVYKQNKDQSNPMDSITEINIKLKKDMKTGYFGKLSAGYGTGKHFDADAGLGIYSPRKQLGIVAASNNINKLASDVNQLMKNNTFKGVGANIDYQPNFTIQGVHQPNSGGFIYQQDFIDAPDYYKNDRLIINYFLNNNTNRIASASQTITSLGSDSFMIRQNAAASRFVNTEQKLDALYDKQDKRKKFYVSAKVDLINSNQGNDVRQHSELGGRLQSTANITNEELLNSAKISLETGFSRQKPANSHNRIPGDWDIVYSLNTKQDDQLRSAKNDFRSYSDLKESQYFNRKYDNITNSVQQHLFVKYGGFSKWLFPGNEFISSIDLTLQNNLFFENSDQHNIVKDGDSLNNSFEMNSYLTNKSKYTVINELPAIKLSREMVKSLSDRYRKVLSVSMVAQAQLFYQQNVSGHDFQNFSHQYQAFVPYGSISYNQDYFAEYENTYALKFALTSDYPMVDQLVPLVDSINIYALKQGNTHLLPYAKKELSFTLDHTGYKQQAFSYQLVLSGGIINNFFGDSIIIDPSGRYSYFTVNMDGHRYLNVHGTLKRTFKLHNSQVQGKIDTRFYLSRNPGYLRSSIYTYSILNISNNRNSDHQLAIYYSWKDILNINLAQQLSYYKSRQSSIINNIGFNNSTLKSILSMSANFTKKLSAGSHISYNSSTSAGSPTIHFTIWNADVAYRFMKRNNLELKAAVLDILHQNKNIINTGGNYNLTRSTVNVLQQYAILTLSYFPRKYGAGK